MQCLYTAAWLVALVGFQESLVVCGPALITSYLRATAELLIATWDVINNMQCLCRVSRKFGCTLLCTSGRVLVKARNRGAPPRYACREMGGVKHFVESYAVAVPVLSLVTVHTAVQ